MINSFWNICSTCPMPKEEKLNSEYKRNYVWHPQYKPLAQDVVSSAPQPVAKDVMQRRKQYPDLAYRTHEVIRHDVGQQSKDGTDLGARSEERDIHLAPKSGPRSRSAEPTMSRQQQKLIMIQSFPPIASGRVAVLPKTDEIPDISEYRSETSEYKSQFAWPKKSDENIPCTARKSVSMGVIKGVDEADALPVPKVKLAPVHRPCAKQKDISSIEKPLHDSKKKVKTEYKSKYKPFTSYVYVDGQWKKTSRLLRVPEKHKPETSEEPWFLEVVERLQKANEYRWRGHGHPVYGELLPDIYEQPAESPVPRSKAGPTNLQLQLPKVHESSSKKGESKKKELHIEATTEKKREKETNLASVLRRPKSAEPAKAKEQVKHKRPATTPPAKITAAHVSHIKKTALKEKEVEKKTKAARSNTSKKTKEDSAKQLSSSKKLHHSPYYNSPGSGGKVWLQAGQHVSEHPAVDEPALKERSDAVGPSSLLPSPPAPVPEEPFDKVSQKHLTSEEPTAVEVKHVIPHSVVPLTHVRTPEEVTGVKSPDPENWTVPIENSERLEWSKVNTSEVSPKDVKPLMEEVSEKLSKLPASGDTVPNIAASQESASAPTSAKLTSSNVLDRARSRLDQFWGKNK